MRRCPDYSHLAIPMAIGLCVALQACATEPVVQTPTMMRILTKEISPNGTVAPEAGRLITDARMLDPVVRVTSRLIAATKRATYGSRARALCWVIALYDDRSVARSFVRPDGAIVVSSGAFRLAQSEAGLAALLSHELVHALVHDETPVPADCVSAIGQQPALAPHEEELQTDETALYLMADAGYDPRELLGLWERIKREYDSDLDEVLKHFTYDRRIEQIRQWLPSALMRYERSNRAPQKGLPLK